MQHGTKQTMVRFEKQSQTRHAVSGELIDDWKTDPLEVWVRLEAKRVKESVMLGSREVQVTHLLFGDADDLEAITDDMRMVWEPTEQFVDGSDEYLPGLIFFRITGIQRDYVSRRQTIISLTEVDDHAAN